MERNIELSMLLSYYGAFLTQRQQDLLALHVDEDYSLSEIAERENISRQGVHDALKRAEAQLYEMETRLGLVRRVRQMEDGLLALKAQVEQMELGRLQRQVLLEKIAGLRGVWEDEHGV